MFHKTMLAAGLGLSLSAPAMAQDSKPNILVFLADDMGYSDIGSFGSEIKTPNLDRLAEEGMRLTNFHVGGACSPTRTMLMTGVDNHLAGLGNMVEIQADNQFGKPGYEGYLNDRVVTVASRLLDAGYNTYMVGKWHLGKKKDKLPSAQGFEKTFTLMESGADNWVEQPYGPMYESVHYYENGKPINLPTDGYFSTDFYTDRVIDYIDADRKDGKPFFAYVAYQAVHYPYQVPQEFSDKYNGVYDDGFVKLRERRLKGLKELGIVSADLEIDSKLDKTTYGPWVYPDWDALSEEEKKFNARRMQTYAGMADNMDVNIGKVLDYVESIGETDNTLVIFLSDNGADPNQFPIASPANRKWYEEHYDLTYLEDYDGDYSKMGTKGSYADYGPGWAAASNTPNSYYKLFSTEGALRVPFIAHYPNKIAPGNTSHTFGFVKDIVPTLLEVAGIESTEENGDIHPPTGVSMWSVLTGKSNQIHAENEAIGYELAGSSAIFRGKYKLVKNPPPKGTGMWELYDIETDPSELYDLSKDNPQVAAELAEAYASYEKENGIVAVPEGYNPFEQIAKNAKRKK
ncbi:MAG: sulfatase-like hydrolase/transferase [Roseibium sp.]